MEETKKETWGTWEELLLACAVKRHGTKNWDSVAMEIQYRSSTLNLLVTPQNCKQKYHDLHRRFMVKGDKIVDSEDKSDTDHHKKDDKIPWLDELRKLRVAELRRDVQRSDVSIVSLQLKVKRLKEERDESLRENDNSDVKPDLQEVRTEVEKKERESEPERSSPRDDVAGKPVSGDDSDRDNQSFSESNSTDLKDENRETGVEEREKKPEPVQTATEKSDPVLKNNNPVGDCSYDGSSETIANDSVAPAVKKLSEAIPVRERRESVAESKEGNEEGTKESSDVQSSASLSKRNHRRRKIISGSSSGEERETDDVSPAIKPISVKSHPLVDFLGMIQSHKFGFVFESRLASQETANYRSLIRRHIDLETVQTRLREGQYSGCSRNFFRDLLLLFNNAIIFFPKHSSESVAATELRELVTKELATRSRTKNHPTPEEPTPPTIAPPSPSLPKPDSEPCDSLLLKPKIYGGRRRSLISSKASNNVAPVEKKRDEKVTQVEEKPVVDKKQTDNSSAAEQSLLNKRKGERSASGTRSSRSSKRRSNTNNNGSKNSNSNQNPNPSLNRNSSGKVTDDNNSESKTEKEKKNNGGTIPPPTTIVGKKKSGVVNFLNRMKRNSCSSNGTLLETLKSSSVSSNNKRGEGGGNKEKEEEKGGGGGGSGSGGRKEQLVTRQSSSGRQSSSVRQSQAREQSGPAKRSVGRPPKRAPPPPPPPSSSSKRTREPVEPEVKQPRKRTRR